MAATLQGARLTQAHRSAQVRNAAAVALLVQRYFRITVDPRRLVESSEVWLAAVLPIILRSRERSAALSAMYAREFRILEGIAALEPITFPQVLDGTDESTIRKSLAITGTVNLQKRLGTLSGNELTPLQESQLQQALRSSGAQAGASAVRHVQNAGRDTLINAVQEDKRALGYVRVTRDSPCYFCAMLASRGPVYKDDSFEDSDPRFHGFGEHKVHDSCGCSMEPTYSRSAPWPGRAAEWSEQWAKLPAPTLANWRKQFEGRG